MQERTGYWFKVAKTALVALPFVVFVIIWDNFDILVPSSYASGQRIQSPPRPYPGLSLYGHKEENTAMILTICVLGGGFWLFA